MTLSEIQQDYRDLDQYLQDYNLGKILKLELLGFFVTRVSGKQALLHVSTYRDRVRSRLSDTLIEQLLNIKNRVRVLYLQAMNHASTYERYNTKDFFR